MLFKTFEITRKESW